MTTGKWFICKSRNYQAIFLMSSLLSPSMSSNKWENLYFQQQTTESIKSEPLPAEQTGLHLSTPRSFKRRAFNGTMKINSASPDLRGEIRGIETNQFQSLFPGRRNVLFVCPSRWLSGSNSAFSLQTCRLKPEAKPSVCVASPLHWRYSSLTWIMNSP